VPVLTVVCVAFVLDGNVWLTFSLRKWLWSVCAECVFLYLTYEQSTAHAGGASEAWHTFVICSARRRSSHSFQQCPLRKV
jgi:hypothetical protein